MPYTLITPPSVEPVDITFAKLWSKVDYTDDDTLFTLLCPAARRYAEHYCNSSFITQTWRLTMDGFPGPSQFGVPFGERFGTPGHAIVLERGPVQAISSITYIAMDGSTQTMPATDYVADLSGKWARITPVFGKIWPIPLPQIGAVRVDFTAGYGDTAATVPEGLRQWILMRASTQYDNRNEVAVMNRGKIEPLPFVDSLLDPYVRNLL